MADWDNRCYYTYDPKFEANQLEAFFNLYEKVFEYICLSFLQAFI